MKTLSIQTHRQAGKFAVGNYNDTQSSLGFHQQQAVHTGRQFYFVLRTSHTNTKGKDTVFGFSQEDSVMLLSNSTCLLVEWRSDLWSFGMRKKRLWFHVQVMERLFLRRNGVWKQAYSKTSNIKNVTERERKMIFFLEHHFPPVFWKREFWQKLKIGIVRRVTLLVLFVRTRPGMPDVRLNKSHHDKENDTRMQIMAVNASWLCFLCSGSYM